jgi:hypothetical protein
MRQVKKIRISCVEFLQFCLVKGGWHRDLLAEEIDEFSVSASAAGDELVVLLASDHFPDRDDA